MEHNSRMKFVTLVQREMQEFRTSLLWTPIFTAAGLSVLMLISVLLAGRFAMLGDGIIHIFDGSGDPGVINLELSVGEDPESGEQDLMLEKLEDSDVGQPLQPLTITENPGDIPEEEWNFSQEWTFSAPGREVMVDDNGAYESVNPLFNGLHSVFLLILFFVSINFLASCLFDDRKDRSILFWKSMPVSEGQEVLAKLFTITLVAPAIYLAVSLVTQLVFMGLGSLMVWRMDGTPSELLGQIQLGSLMFNQLGGIIVWMLFSLPLYAWIMLNSAAAKRSPMLLTIFIPLGLVFAERILFGTQILLGTIANHMPRMVDGDDASSLGFYSIGPVWSQLDYLGMLLGIVVAAAFLAGAVWLRRHRFEI